MDRKKEINLYIFLLLFIIKFTVYYFLIGISDSIILHVVISAGLLYIIFLYSFKTSLKRKIFFALYLVISFLMLVNVVYTKYFNESFRLEYFRYISEFIDVINILPSIIEAKHFLILLDIAVLGYFLMDIKHRKDNIEFNKYVPITAFVLILTFTTLNPLSNDDIESVGNTEFFNYYVKDAYSLLYVGEER